MDIERCEPGRRDIASRFFHREEVRYLNTVLPSARDDAFYKLWTLKESFVKSTGRGLDLPLRSFWVDIHRMPPRLDCAEVTGNYSLFLSGAVTFWDRLSVGAELTYYFGNLERHSTIDYDNSSYRSWDTGTKHHVYGISGKFGIQYEQDFSGFVLCVGTAAAGNALKLKEGSRIKLGDCDVSTKYDSEKKITYTNFKLFSFEYADSEGAQTDNTAPQPIVDEGELDDSRLPF